MLENTQNYDKNHQKFPVADLPEGLKASVGDCEYVKVTLEPIPDEADSTPSFLEILNSIEPSEIKDGRDGVTIIREMREERTRRILGE